MDAHIRFDTQIVGALPVITQYFDRLGLASIVNEAVQTALVMKAIKMFKLDVSQIHYDITDVELYGAYERALTEGETAPVPMPAYGWTKSGRKNVKQIQAGLNVTRDGGVPVGHLPLDGNAAERSMRTCKRST